jgi:FkbM family methyltransferase
MIQHSKAWEKHLLDKMLEHYKPDTNMLDIGANYGCHSVGVGNEIKKNGGRGKIYSFELQPNILTLLKENISMNGLSEIIQVYEHGLGDKNETKVFALPSDYDDNTNPGALSLHNEHSNLDKGKTVQDTQVNIRRLDDLAIHNISFIKIDVEGYELEVFEGGKETISREKPVIMIEIWGRVKDKYYAWIQNNFPFYEIQHISGEDYLLVPRA